MKVKYSDLYSLNKSFENDFYDDVKNIFQNSSFVGGDFVDNFEKDFASYTKNKFCVAASSGSDCLSIILRSLDLEPNDGVIYYPSNTFIGSILGALQLGFKCKPYDVSLDTFNAEEENFKSIKDDAIAVIAVHLYGYGLRSIKNLKSFCENKKIHLIEDCSQSHFQTYEDGKQVSNFGIASFFSMYPGKNFGAAGQAGAICANDLTLVNKMKAIRNYGASKKYEHDHKGFNFRMDAIQAAFLTRKLHVMETEIKNRRKVANRILNEVNNKKIKHIGISSHESVWHILPVLCDEREKLIHYLNEKDIETVIHYPKSAHEFPTWKNNILPGITTNADILSRSIVSLPCHGSLTEEEIAYVIKVMNEFS